MRQIRHDNQSLAKAALDFGESRFDNPRAFSDRLRFDLASFGLVAASFAHQRSDVFADPVGGGIQVVALAHKAAPLEVQLDKPIEDCRIEVSGRKPGADGIKILPDKARVQHSEILL